MEATQQVLRQLDPVDPQHEAPPRQLGVELCPLGAAGVGGGRGGQVVGVGAERGDERVRRGDAVGLARGDEVGRPARRVEAAGVVGGHALQQLAAGLRGQHGEQLGGGERRVGEVHGAQVGAALDEGGGRAGRGGSPARGRPHPRVRRRPPRRRTPRSPCGRRPTPATTRRRSAAAGPGRTGGGARTRGWRCTPRRRPCGSRRGRARGAGRGGRRRRSPGAAGPRRRRGRRRRSPWRASSPRCRPRAGPAPTPAHRRPAGPPARPRRPAGTTPGPGSRRS